MMFTLQRNYTLRSRFGRLITFVKGKSTHVPPEMVKEALAIGALPDNPEDMEKLERAEEAAPARNDDARDPLLRGKRIKEMLAFMKERNLREYFTAAGGPSLKHLSMLCGFEVDKRERDQHWLELIGGGEEIVDETRPAR